MTAERGAVRAVVDSGVFVSALLSSIGAPDAIVRAMEAGAFECLVCPALLAELERVLRRPKFADRINAEDIDAFLDLTGETATMSDDPDAIPPRAPDLADDYLAALAEATSATHLVTGDTALRTVQLPGIAVVTPRQFVDDALGGAGER